jgi:hypothetical protein
MSNQFFNDTVDPNTGAAPSTLELEDVTAEFEEDTVLKESSDMFIVDIHGKQEYITKKEALTILCQLNAQMMIEYENATNGKESN